MCVHMLSCFNHVQLFMTLWTVAHQAPLSMGFSRQEYWSGLPSSRGSSRPKDHIQVSFVSCIGRQILYHWCYLGSTYIYLREHIYLLEHSYFLELMTWSFREVPGGPAVRTPHFHC